MPTRGLVLPVAATSAVTPKPSAHIKSIRALSFWCCVPPQSSARSSGGSWIYDSFIMPQTRIDARLEESFC